MTLDRARELLAVQVYIAQGYNRNAARLIMAEVQREHGVEAPDQFINELDMTGIFGFEPGQVFESP